VEFVRVKKGAFERQPKRGVAPRPTKISIICLVNFIALSIFSIV
jgi:hypothetical protein